MFASPLRLAKRWWRFHCSERNVGGGFTAQSVRLPWLYAPYAAILALSGAAATRVRYVGTISDPQYQFLPTLRRNLGNNFESALPIFRS